MGQNFPRDLEALLHCAELRSLAVPSSPQPGSVRGQAGADAVRQVLRSGLLSRRVIMFRGISLMIPDSYWA